MNYLSYNSEYNIQVAIESYLIENILKLNNDTIQRINQERYNEDILTVNYPMEIFLILFELFISNGDFASFSISNNLIDKSDIIEILRYCKIKYTTMYHYEWWYSQISDWWREDLTGDNDFNISYIISWFVYLK